ncbi:ankyrin [Coprinopsis marcescibilis]|uniref:Ankyrin n=1 Tax=Coprinopsis marcescibilis TaxID=230819 RepID=A0A5C3L0D3_COPMA|nr:ankyrin [Coprinopsis marcescibilis]
MGANFSRMVMQLYIFRTHVAGQANAFTGAENTHIINSTVNNVAGGQHNVTNIYVPNDRTAEDIAKCIPWLTKYKFRTIHLDNLGKRTPNTVMWIFETADFKMWVESECGILWGTGMPGAGKTILSSVVIDHLQSLAQGNSGICIVFAFCRYTEAVPVRDILAGILRQMLERYPVVWQFVRAMYELHQREGTEPTQHELFEILKKISTSGVFKKCFYVLDGLDEASSETQFDILAAISQLPINFFITSRPLPLLKDVVFNARFFDIVAHNSDIALLIEEKLRRSPSLLRLVDGSQKTVIVETILQKSLGMFLLASLQVDIFNTCPSIESIQDALNGLPDGVEAMYAATMRRVEDLGRYSVDVVKRALVWVLYTAESLGIDDLRHAIAVHSDSFAFSSTLLVDEDNLLSMCCGLITIESESRTVRLVHYTAREPLQSYIATTIFNPQEILSSTCVARLHQFNLHDYSTCNELVDSLLLAHPFLKYPFDHWVTHARLCTSLPSTVLQFIAQCQWFPFRNANLPIWGWDYLKSIHVFAAYALNDALSAILSNVDLHELDVNSKTANGATALGFAAALGNLETVKLLLGTSGIDAVCSDAEGWTPLMNASNGGSTEIVEELLGVLDSSHANAANHDGDTALLLAASNGYAGVMEVLFQVDGLDVNVNAANNAGLTALLWAVGMNHVSVAQRLLSIPDLDPNLTDVDGDTPFMNASRIGNLTMVEALLASNRCNLNAQNSEGATALMRAVEENHVPVVQRLLSIPELDPNLMDNNGEDAFMDACYRGNLDMVEALVASNRCNPNARNNEGLTALMWAVEEYHVTVVQRLLSIPDLDPNLTGAYGDTVFATASRLGNLAMVEALLASNRCNLNAQNNKGMTALMCAVREDHVQVVQRLLSLRELNPNLTDNKGEDAFMNACRLAHSDMVDLLINSGKFNVNAENLQGETGLMMSLLHHNEEVTECLLQVPDIDPTLGNRDSWTEAQKTSLRLAVEQANHPITPSSSTSTVSL